MSSPESPTPSRFLRLLLVAAFGLVAASSADAQDVTIYDDLLQNGFLNYSYGGQPGDIDFGSTAQAHGGAKSIAFTGNAYNAISFAHTAQVFSTASYPTLRFWVHGGAAGGQQLRLYLQLANGVVAQAELDSYISGGALAAGTWREVSVPLGQAPLSYAGSFDRIDLQSDAGGGQPTLYVDDVTLVAGVAQGAGVMQIERGVTVASMVSDRFTWFDGAAKPRVAVLAHNDGQVGPGGVRGGALREFRYQMPDSSTRVAGVTNYGNGGYGGFGYVVSHAANSTCIGDDSPLGDFFPGQFQRVFEGRHHAIFRFTQNYVRNCSTTLPVVQRTVPVTIDWVFATGRDNPLWAITYDISGTPVNTFFDDSRAPYGELAIDGQGFTNIDGVAWGDRYKFTSTSAPVTLNSQWTWNVPNTVPYVKLWVTSTNATMGLVQSQPIAQQDAGGGRNAFYHDMTAYWNKTSAMGNAGGADVMPWQDSWPYQANAFSIGPNTPNANSRLTWGTQYGFLGQQSYDTRNGLVATAAGWPRKSYSTYVVMGPHTADPVGAQVAQVEAVSSLTLTATLGSVVTSGPAGNARADNMTYVPAGYNPVYGALAFLVNANRLDANIAVGSGTLRKPLLILGGYSGATYPTSVKLGGVALASDVDYFASIRAGSNELWITLNRDLSGAVNHLEVGSASCAGTPPAPTISASGPTTFCSGGSVTLTASVAPGAGVSYSWSPGGQTTQAISATATGRYSVTVTVNGCPGTSPSTAVTVNSVPTPSIAAPASATAGQSGLAASTTGAGGDTYAWGITNGTITGGQGTSQITFTAGAVGALGLTVVRTSGGCSSLQGTATVTVTSGQVQGVIVYDDALQNGFLNYSYGGQPGDIDFASTAQAHSGTKSIAFTGNSYNAVSFAHTAQVFTTASYPTLRFWVHGGASGGQQLRLYLQLNDAVVAQAELDSYIAGGAPAAGTWREVTVPFGQAPLSYAGSFDRIDLQSDVGGAQARLYVDDVSLLPGATCTAPPTPSISAPASAVAGQTGLTASTAGVGGDTFAWGITNGTITGGQGTSQITFTAGAAGSLGLTVVRTSGGCASPQGSASVTVTAVAGGCTPNAATLCLNNSRFRLSVAWKNPYDGGTTGVGTAVPLTSDSGYFWFFASSNIELVVKVLDGRGVNGKFWVLYGALSDVEYTITITDTQNGNVKTYFNPGRNLASVADVNAFPGSRPESGASLTSWGSRASYGALATHQMEAAAGAVRRPLAPATVDKWSLWSSGVKLRGANVFQRRRYGFDGTEFLGSGVVGPPFTQQDFDRLAALGANVVQLSHPGLFTEDPPYVLDTAVQSNLDSFVSMASQAGLYVVIGFRTGPGRSEATFGYFPAGYDNDTVWTNQAAHDAWADMWRAVAQRYGGNPAVVGYDLMVEPNSNARLLNQYDPAAFYAQYGGTLYDWNALYPSITAAIRQVDAATPILIGGMSFSSIYWLNSLQPTSDPKTVYTVHNYEPFVYTHQSPPNLTLGYPGTFDGDGDGTLDSVNLAWLRQSLAPIDTFKAAHPGKPVAVNEFGVKRWQPGADQYIRDLTTVLEEKGANHAVWTWASSWAPGASDDDFNFRHGADPNSHTDVATSPLLSAVKADLARNAAAGCTGGATLCLAGDRFRLSVAWRNYNDGSTGVGTAVKLTDDSGYFWFFNAANVELMLKVLDGRATNGKFWVFYGALSDVEYTITVTDTQTGAVKTYLNPAHTLGSRADIDAF